MISVAIPLYNKVRHIRRTLDSILGQTHRDFEVIVVNDGSTDGSEKLVEQYADPRIRLITQDNAGEMAARNRGIAEARSDLVAFLDADDEWLPEHLETIARLSANHPDCGMYATGRIAHKQDGCEVKLRYSEIPRAPWEGVVPNYFRVNPSPVCSSTSAIWKRVFEDVGYFPGVQFGHRGWNYRSQVGEPSGDVDMWCRVALKYHVAFSTHYGAITYEDTDNRTSGSIAGPVYTTLIRTLDSALSDKKLPDWVTQEDVRDFRNHAVVVAARTGLVNLQGYAATARGMLMSTWATRELRPAVALWFLLSFLPSGTVAALWRAVVALGRFAKRVLGVQR
ncbi:glycosyltransferase family 2 protein [candidate division WOR-3 bacterium]|nr:glycosyltransferase family 2 protein [candidate division WOR-3 bacterium]